MDIRRAIRRTGQVLLCAGALAGGALLSWATDGSGTAAASAGQFPPPMPPAEHFEAAREEDEASSPPSADAADEAPTLAAAVRTEAVPAPPAEPSPGPFGEPLREGRVITGRTPHRLILFTFDDGPDARNTPRLLDVLDDHGVHAVFFLTANRLDGAGPWHRTNQDLAREIVARGHMVANHTVDHAQLPLLDDAGVLAQVRGADRIFERVLGQRTWLMRPPGGARSERVDALLADRGYTQVLWNLGTGDFQVRDAEEVFRIWRRVLERREREHGDRGGIVLLHDTHEWSVEAVPMILGWLDDRNCELLAEGRELYDVVGDPSYFFAPRGDASPSAEAPPASPSERVLEARQRALRAETRRRCGRVARLD
ncbi:MAG TPA: polysaccharide deacetylase family protein [Sandaracinaceae bacterium LLY-WYZ-13_1]|nr:polysaccharide deacetylase family protein [Sandaracinaceae bacterium LLY-WYZ-13_1]